MCDKESTGVEKNCLGKVDESTHNTVCAAFHETTPHIRRESLVRCLVKFCLEDAFEYHGTDMTNVGDCLERVPSAILRTT